MIGRVRRFRSNSKVKQIDLYSRGMLYVAPWLFVLIQAGGLVAPARYGPGVQHLALGLIAVSAVQAGTGIGLLRRALDRYLGKGEPRLRGRLALSFALLAAAIGLLAAVLATAFDEQTAQNAPTMLMGVAMVPLGAFCLIVRKRVYAAVCTVVSLLANVPFVLTGTAGAGMVGPFAGSMFVSGWVLLMVRVTAWMLSIIWEVDAARGVQARLAVAEERLRFSRDMHDILGRNLAAIALKSELAVQLSRRGSAAAADQMAEVQRIAQESQRELREVVRGYREADLHTELVGARGILAAAGIECRIDDAAVDELPPPVQSALAWVVREATTNVLRHADAGRCALRLRRVDGRAVLVVENNGVREAGAGGSGAGGGSGLAGLRERLTGLGGTLTCEYGANGTFLLTARVPVAATAAEGAKVEELPVPAPFQGTPVPERTGS